MNLLGMAIRNLGRNRRRSFLAVLSVFIAIALVVFMDGLISGVVDSLARNFTKNETGMVNVTTTEYRQRERFMPASAAIKDSDALVAANILTFEAISYQAKGRWSARGRQGAIAVQEVYAGGPPYPGGRVA